MKNQKALELRTLVTIHSAFLTGPLYASLAPPPPPPLHRQS